MEEEKEKTEEVESNQIILGGLLGMSEEGRELISPSQDWGF